MTTARHAGLSDEQALLVDVVESLNTRNVTEAAQGIDHDDAVADDVLAAIEQAGLFQLMLSATETPQDAATLSTLVINRLATASPAIALMVGSAHAATAAALAGDDPAQAATVVDTYRRLAFVDGTDALAAAADQGWVIDGVVETCPGALDADALVVVARDPDAQPFTLLVTVGTQGVTVEPAEPRSGLRGSGLARVRFDTARLSHGARLGGQAAALAGPRLAALTVAAAAVGVAEAAIEQARAYLRQRHQFGQALAGFAVLRTMIGAMAAQRDAAWALTQHAARASGSLEHRAALVATQAAVDIALDALQLHGGYGYTQEFPIERWLRDAVSLRARAGGLRRHLAHSADEVLGAAPTHHDTPSFVTAAEGTTR